MAFWRKEVRMVERRELLESMGLKKAPELVQVRGLVAPGVADTLENLAKESSLKVEEVVGIALADWTERIAKRLRRLESEPNQVKEA